MFDVESLVKYLLEGLAVAVAALVIPQRSLNVRDVLMLALTAAATFAVLDQFSPGVASGTRFGAGFGLGLNQVGGTCGAEGCGLEDME